jgi:hypothetical protein
VACSLLHEEARAAACAGERCDPVSVEECIASREDSTIPHDIAVFDAMVMQHQADGILVYMEFQSGLRTYLGGFTGNEAFYEKHFSTRHIASVHDTKAAAKWHVCAQSAACSHTCSHIQHFLARPRANKSKTGPPYLPRSCFFVCLGAVGTYVGQLKTALSIMLHLNTSKPPASQLHRRWEYQLHPCHQKQDSIPQREPAPRAPSGTGASVALEVDVAATPGVDVAATPEVDVAAAPGVAVVTAGLKLCPSPCPQHWREAQRREAFAVSLQGNDKALFPCGLLAAP